ncbi:MAG TPA: hypothetical protein VM802_06930 [Chitinophaga sp.]|uniref:hypothetical protein n=1 Tax=Chitinophaga sp. TaxID=1869181 RepID=UPI002C87D843|nr:hypothetical protein [Chitinophaga sp.]HVI44584.1 hypothetical protein [Chitinophaga sp.]
MESCDLITAYEADILKNKNLSPLEKECLLITASIVRYSTSWWATRYPEEEPGAEGRPNKRGLKFLAMGLHDSIGAWLGFNFPGAYETEDQIKGAVEGAADCSGWTKDQFYLVPEF